jgi:hypothetical protein
VRIKSRQAQGAQGERSEMTPPRSSISAKTSVRPTPARHTAVATVRQQSGFGPFRDAYPITADIDIRGIRRAERWRDQMLADLPDPGEIW